MKNVRWAVIAPGRISEVFTKALMSVQNAIPYAVASRDLERSKEYAKKWGFEKAYGSYAEAFADPNVDAVYIASLNNTHYSLSIEALKAGKHVFCEKPATLTVAQLEEVLQTAKEVQKFYSEATWMKFLPSFLHAKEIVNSGKLGELRSISANFLINRPDSGQNDRLHKLEFGGGALVDIGIYAIAYSLGIAQAAGYTLENITGFAQLTESGVDIEETISAQFTNGNKRALAHLWCSLAIEDDHKLNGAYIVGTKGRILMSEFWRGRKLEFYNEETKTTETHDYEPAINGFEYEIEEATRCIMNGELETPLHTHQDSLDCMNAMQKLRHGYGLFYAGEKA